MDILIRILCFQEQQLCYNDAGRSLIDFLSQKNDSVLQQSGINIIRPLTFAGLFNDVRYQTHILKPPLLLINIIIVSYLAGFFNEIPKI
jgi:hypothetical protein